MKRCTRCLMPDTRPDTAFVEGVCSACISFKKRKQIDWVAREQALVRILEESRAKNGGEFDCIVPSSGGKDSTWQVLKLIDLGAKPLVVTATTCHLTEIGRRNIDNLARYATTMEISPNKTVRAKLNRLGLELVGDVSWPEHVAIFTIPMNWALTLECPLIFYGENPQEAYGGPPGADEAREMTQRWVSEFGGFLGLRARDMVGQLGITADDMRQYAPLHQRTPGNALPTTAYFLGAFYEWDSVRNGDVALAHGMECAQPSPANWWWMENLDNAQTGIHDHMMFLKYGYGRGCAQISVDIRAGRVDRASALSWLLSHDGLLAPIYAGVPIDEVLDRVEVTGAELIAICNRFTNWDLFDKAASKDDAPRLREELWR